MDDVIFSPLAMQEYIEWQAEERKTLARINEIIKIFCETG
jgi:Txe/YoeB family toxin of Txe-Axe toxin-antitoxin module